MVDPEPECRGPAARTQPVSSCAALQFAAIVPLPAWLVVAWAVMKGQSRFSLLLPGEHGALATALHEFFSPGPSTGLLKLRALLLTHLGWCIYAQTLICSPLPAPQSPTFCPPQLCHSPCTISFPSLGLQGQIFLLLCLSSFCCRTVEAELLRMA